MGTKQIEVLFDALIEQYDKDKQATLKMMYLRCVQAEEARQRQEREKLKREIVAEVLQQISVSADTKEAVLKIEELQKILNNLIK